MRESYLQVEDGYLFVRHSEIRGDRSSIVCLHGLGESGLSFAEIFARPELADYNLVVPDLLGFGLSSMAANEDYSFTAQAGRIWTALDHLGIQDATFVGHSMGGDLATLMTNWDQGGRIKSLVNVEGNLTRADMFISSEAVKAEQQGRFTEWFATDFQQARFRSLAQERPSGMRYFASLLLCRPEAFRASALELDEQNDAPDDSSATEIARSFMSREIPRVFCWGSDGPSEASKELLRNAAFCHHEFAGASHWVMVDRAEEFYPFLQEFCDHNR